MYTPSAFQESDPNRLFDFIEQHSFATLVSPEAAEPLASHLPLLIDRSVAPHGRLIGHMARANSQWRTADSRRVLAVFHGPHAYVSHTWYEEENAVPTWNYAAVHAYGVLRRVEDRDRLRAIVARTVDTYESSLPNPWRLDSQDAGFIDGLLAAIVGFEIDVDRLEGKWKLNQNQNAQRRERVAAVLERSPQAGDREVAELMRQRQAGSEP
jgi:transcriptional regulator